MVQAEKPKHINPQIGWYEKIVPLTAKSPYCSSSSSRRRSSGSSSGRSGSSSSSST